MQIGRNIPGMRDHCTLSRIAFRMRRELLPCRTCAHQMKLGLIEAASVHACAPAVLPRALCSCADRRASQHCAGRAQTRLCRGRAWLPPYNVRSAQYALNIKRCSRCHRIYPRKRSPRLPRSVPRLLSRDSGTSTPEPTAAPRICYSSLRDVVLSRPQKEGQGRCMYCKMIIHRARASDLPAMPCALGGL